MENLIDELKEASQVQEFADKHRAARRYNSIVKIREIQLGDLVLKEMIMLA